MTGAANFPVLSAVAMPIARRPVARAGNTFDSNGLRDNATNEGYRRKEKTLPPPQKIVSQIETDSAPTWHAQRLSSPFVAQVLGQVLTQGAPDAASARAAYAGIALISQGRALDCNV